MYFQSGFTSLSGKEREFGGDGDLEDEETESFRTHPGLNSGARPCLSSSGVASTRSYVACRRRNGEKRGRRFWTAVGSMVYKRDDEGDGAVWGSTVKKNVGLSRIILGVFLFLRFKERIEAATTMEGKSHTMLNIAANFQSCGI